MVGWFRPGLAIFGGNIPPGYLKGHAREDSRAEGPAYLVLRFLKLEAVTNRLPCNIQTPKETQGQPQRDSDPNQGEPTQTNEDWRAYLSEGFPRSPVWALRSFDQGIYFGIQRALRD